MLTCMEYFIEDLETWLERVYQADGECKTLDALYDEWTGYYDQILFINSSSQLMSAFRV
jgi:hypothetical protein